MAINLDHVTEQITVTDTATNADLTFVPKGTGQTKAINSTSSIMSSVGQSGYGSFLAQGSTGNAAYYFGYSGSSEVGRITMTGNTDFGTSSSALLQLRVANTASAVNYVQTTGAATGSGPTISAQGSDTNVNLFVSPKGTGALVVNTAGGYQFIVGNTPSTVNWLEAKGGATGFGPLLSAQGTDTNIPLVLQPKGTGALQAQQTTSTATGGNTRGQNAVDWQTIRNLAASVASGAYSVIGGGYDNKANGFAGFVGGGLGNNQNGGNYGLIGGGALNTTGASTEYATIVGGYSNTANGYLNFIGGGYTNSGTSGSVVTTQSATMNGTTAVTLSGSNASIKVGQLITGTSINTFPHTYVAAISGTSLTLSQAASGSSTSTISFYTPHGVVVGGGNNQATGSYSFIGGGGDAGTASSRNIASGDWSTVCGGWQSVASGAGAFVGGGGNNSGSPYSNFASATSSAVVGGVGNTASGSVSFLGGGYGNLASGVASAILGGVLGTTRAISGNQVASACNNPIGTASLGVSQSALLVLGRVTTDATATRLTSDSTTTGNTTNQVILPNNSAYFFTGEVVAGVTGGGDTKGWTIEGVIKRGANAASTALVGTPTVTSTYADAGASTWVIAVTADTTNGGLAVTFTGQAATTIRVVCQVRTTEMTF